MGDVIGEDGNKWSDGKHQTVNPFLIKSMVKICWKSAQFFKTKSYKYYQLITYDETIPFNKRMIYIYNEINSDYVIFLGDNIVLTSINENKVISIVEWLKNNNYDSVQFHIKKNNLDLITINNDISLKFFNLF